MLTTNFQSLQTFGQFAQSNAQRSHQSLKAIDGTIDDLSSLKNEYLAIAAMADEAAIEFASKEEPIDPDGVLVSTLELIRDSYGELYLRLREKRNALAHMLDLRPDDGLLEGYDGALAAIADVHNATNDLGWAMGEHDADFEKPSNKSYTNLEEMFRDMEI